MYVDQIGGTRRMKHDFDNLYEGPRLERRLKRKKYNRILNVLIGVVVILIVYFGSQLFFSNEHKSSTANSEQQQPSSEEVKNNPDDNQTEPKDDNENASADENEDTNDEESTRDPESEVDEADKVDDEVIVTNNNENDNVVNTIVNPSWQPVGTVQSEPHTAVYDDESVDWNEMINAVNYATGLTESDYIKWWVGRDGVNKSIITIESKKDAKIYRISIEWVENKGWKPTKIEELKENDAPAYKKQKNNG